jgi:hypothetical protein
MVHLVREAAQELVEVGERQSALTKPKVPSASLVGAGDLESDLSLTFVFSLRTYALLPDILFA